MTEYERQMEELYERWMAGKYLTDAEQHALAEYALEQAHAETAPVREQPQLSAYSYDQ